MKFTKYIPSGVLNQHIKYIVVSETAYVQAYKVLPDTSLVLGFQYKGKLTYMDGAAEKPLAASGITGLQDTFRIFKNSDNIGTILVFFTETGAASFIRHPLNELFSQSLSLEHFISRSALDAIEEQLSMATSDRERITIVEQLLLSRLSNTQPDALVQAAVQQIRVSRGNIRMKELAKALHTSQSPFEKRFRTIVGATPKKFASIVRLRAVLHESAKAKRLTDIGYNAGYFDQSHFIKDFKQFTGETPEQYFGDKE